MKRWEILSRGFAIKMPKSISGFKKTETVSYLLAVSVFLIILISVHCDTLEFKFKKILQLGIDEIGRASCRERV